MNRIVIALAVLLSLFAPSMALAHATPVETVPASSQNVSEAPNEIRIRFSERVERGASRIVVKDEAGQEIQERSASVSPDDAHILTVPIAVVSEGAYFVSWSVVSSDDGHFTKGGFTYFVGDAAGATLPAPQIAVVQLSAIPEAAAIFVELLGNSLLLGALALFAFILRPRLLVMDERARQASVRVHDALILFGVLFALGGALAHILLKSNELAALSEISFLDAFPMYLATASGAATVLRASAVAAFALIFAFRRSAIRAASTLTLSEGALAFCLLMFAYFRSTISHATANPFFPEISLLVNFLHLIAKDVSLGLLAAFCLFLLFPTLRAHFGELLRRGFSLIALAFMVLAPTAVYIVWLHLKDFANVSTTLWGERFLPLLISALLAAGLLAYHVIGRRLFPNTVLRFLSYTIPAECAAAVLIVFFSSLTIITSPPLEGGQGTVLRAQEHSVLITLAPAPYEDAMALITIEGTPGSSFSSPILQFDGEDGIRIEAEKRFPGGYVFPRAAIPPGGPYELSIVAAQEKGYDARATFSITRDMFDPEGMTGHGRTFDAFTLVMLLLGVIGVAYALFLVQFSRDDVWTDTAPGSLFAGGTGFILLVLIASQIMGAGAFVFGNSFKKECVADGNAWHLMLPTRNGIPVSTTPAEGCMALSGSLHIADVREYRSLKEAGESSVIFDTDLHALAAGVPVALNFSMRRDDDTPALLSLVHERYVHIVIISEDMKEFFHIHPDDEHSVTEEEVQTATFSRTVTFPRGGRYLVAIDYANGLALESDVFVAAVVGPPQEETPTTYPTRGSFHGYDISLEHSILLSNEVSTLQYRVEKNGKAVTDLTPYLAAAMHLAIVKNDLSEFVHTHGEVHPPGTNPPPPTKSTVHNHTPPPAQFGPIIDAHPVFPSPGLYTMFGEFMHEGEVIQSAFTVNVE